MMNELITNFTVIIDFLGTFAFAISGIKLASGKNIDLLGAYLIGLVTAIGGGTIRDLLLDATPFWMLDSRYIIITGMALLAIILLKEKLFKWGNTLFIFDAIGLGLFTIVGISKSYDAGLSIWVCILMGTITGCLGGVMRDVLINEVPLIFRKDIYALTCILGGIIYFICLKLELQGFLPEVIGVLTVIVFRIIAVKFHLKLPVLTSIR
ncbi:trimeric intracellular cation channel family protein [Formosa sp. Hel1_33_131]|uniref:trimeric intracellular cation channel family protein n=1 Tax=Formosa sp. Hel1_33_131 TaxID=1336794 RepID=UPI0009F5EDD7|nr:trimeric intracellular cation channel family protein [Formosa sp. Hel1_33_131]